MVSLIHSVLFASLFLLAASENTVPVNETLILDILRCASNYQQFHTFSVLADVETILVIDDWIIDLQKTFHRPTYILSQKTPSFSFRNRIFRQSITFVFFQGISDPIFKMANTYMRGRRQMSVFFILTLAVPNESKALDIMKGIWNANYVRPLLIYRDLDGQDYFVTADLSKGFELKSLIAWYRESDILGLDINGNLNGYKIRTPVKSDLPRVFKVTDKNGNKEYKGYGYQLFMGFVEHINATFEEYNMTVNQTNMNVVMKDIIELIAIGEIEISLHPHALYDLAGVGSSYPIQLSDICIIVPMANEIPSFMYLSRPLRPYSWLLMLFAVCYLTFIMIWIPPHSGGKRTQEFGFSFLHSLSLIINMPSFIYRHNVTWRYFFVHTVGWIMGFFITSWYCAILQSFLNTTVFGPQIDTMEELIESGLKILVTYNDVEDYRQMEHLSKEFRKIFVGTDADSLAQHQIEFNTTYAYAIALDRWNFLDLQQQYSKRPIFRLTPICYYKHHIAYQLAYDSRLQYSLNSYIMRSQQSGFMEYWTGVDFRNALREGYVKLMMDSYSVGPLHNENMRLAWISLSIGLAISVPVFILEIYFLPRFKHFASLWTAIVSLMGRVAGRIVGWGRNLVNKVPQM